MTAGGGTGLSGTRRAAARLAAALPLVTGLLVAEAAVVAASGSAEAQEGGLFGRLFGERPRRYIDEVPPDYAPPPRYYIDPPVQPRPRKPVAPKPPRNAAKKPGPDAAARAAAGAGTAAVAAAAPPVAKAADAKVVLVVGDFMALSLAKGLTAAVADEAGVRIADRTDGSSGLVRDDHFDWPERIGAIMEEEKPAAVVVMLGSNDRQAMRTKDGSDDLRSEDWAAEYTARTESLAKAVADRKLPLVWVGLPAFKSARMSDDVAYFNELYRQAATAAGGEFVDVWDGFVDANGAFASSGPDVAGQPALLRNADGITMTPQGAAKLAFFAEKPLDKLLGKGLGGTAVAAIAEGGKALPQNPANATAVPALALGSPSLDGGEALLGGPARLVDLSRPSPRERLVTVGSPLPAAAGRADDFAWNVKSGPVGPNRPQPPVVSRGSLDLGVSRGSLDLGAVRSGAERPVPPKPMPSLQDAIIDDWASQAKADVDPETADHRSKSAPR